MDRTERSTALPVTADAMGSLAPLALAYVRRANPRIAAEDTAEVPRPTAALPYVPCDVQDVVTIDAERRVMWPQCSGPPAGRASLRAISGGIEVVFSASPGGRGRVLDRRGRLRLPPGVLRAAGFEPGDRALVVRSGGQGGVLLVPADRIGLRVDLG